MYTILQVIDETGPPAFDLTTLQAVKDELGITNTTSDSSIESQISLYSGIIAAYCDRVFAIENVTETFVLDRNECPRVLPLSRYPVNEIYSVEIDGSEISTTDYEIDYSALLHHLGGLWHGKRIAVNYNGGYDLPDGAPASLARACIEFVKDQRLVQGRDPTIREVHDGESGVSYWRDEASNKALPSIVMDLLQPFRRISV